VKDEIINTWSFTCRWSLPQLLNLDFIAQKQSQIMHQQMGVAVFPKKLYLWTLKCVLNIIFIYHKILVFFFWPFKNGKKLECSLHKNRQWTDVSPRP
jgi:hypothetical protein